MLPKPLYNPDLGECYQYGSILAFRSSSWAVNPTIPKSTFLVQIQKNPRKAMNEYGSVKPQAIEAFCKDAGLVDLRANTGRRSPIKEDGSFEDWFLPEGDFEYFFHGDLGETRDAAGFSMAHVCPKLKKVVIDFMMEFIPPPGGSLQYERFKQLVLAIRNRGFYLSKVTFDAWQSRQTMQALANRGLDVSWYSVDKNTEAYDTLLELLLMDKLDYYPHPVFGWEFSNLLYMNGKVDHKPETAKDMTDAIAAVCFHCVESGLMDSFTTRSIAIPLEASPDVAVQSFRVDENGRMIPVLRQPPPLSEPGEEGDDDQGAFPVVFTNM